jgi:chromate transporter
VAEVARFFGWLSLVGFGGPAAHLAIMRRELVDRRRWLSEQEFLDLLGATQLIPGPNSTEMAIHIGYRRAGLRGLLAGGLAFILPASLVTLLASFLYVRFGRLPSVGPVLVGIQASVVAVVALAVWTLGRTALRSGPLWLLALAAFAGSLCGLPELAVFFGGGLLYLLSVGLVAPALRRWRSGLSSLAGLAMPLGGVALSLPLPAAPSTTALSANIAVSLPALALFFLKVGSVIYGSGYVLVALLLRGLVDERLWLSRAAVLDAVAIGQVTPGPVFTTATCVGFLLRGPIGALVATCAIFAPSFALVWGLDRLLGRLRRSPLLRVFLDGVNACSLSLLAATAAGLLLSLAQRGAHLWLGFSLCALGVAAVAKLNPSWLIVAGALAGALLG